MLVFTLFLDLKKKERRGKWEIKVSYRSNPPISCQFVRVSNFSHTCNFSVNVKTHEIMLNELFMFFKLSYVGCMNFSFFIYVGSNVSCMLPAYKNTIYLTASMLLEQTVHLLFRIFILCDGNFHSQIRDDPFVSWILR